MNNRVFRPLLILLPAALALALALPLEAQADDQDAGVATEAAVLDTPQPAPEAQNDYGANDQTVLRTDDAATQEEVGDVVGPSAEGASSLTETEAAASREGEAPVSTEEAEAVTDSEADELLPEEETLAQVEPVAQAEDDTAQAELDAYAAAHKNDLPDGRYAIYTEAPAKDAKNNDVTFSMDVKGGSSKSGASIILYQQAAKDNQRWDITHLESGYATIRSVASGLYLSLAGGEDAYKVEGSARLVQWAADQNSRWQQWAIARLDDGTFTLTSALLKNGARRLLDVQGGKAANSTGIILYKDTSKADVYAANQRWAITVTDDILDKEAAEHKGDLPDGTYLVGSASASSLVLNVQKNSKDDGGSVILYANAPTVNEGWDITNLESGYVTITSSSSGKVLDVRGGKAKAGATVFQWAEKEEGARNQQWIATLEADGTYKLTSALVGDVRYVLAVSGSAKSGAKIALKADAGSAAKAQHWTVAQAPEQYAYAHAIADGTYLIRTPLDLTKVLDVSGNSKNEGAQVKIWQCKLSDNQYWILSHDNQGYVHLKNKNSGRYLVLSAKAVNGSIVTQQGSTTSSAANRWVVEPADADGAFVIRDAKTGRCIDLSKKATANGSKVIGYKATGGENQQWIIAQALKIAIDPGHGGNDSGAVGNGMRECDLTWSIAQAAATQLKAYGFEVFMTIGQNEFRNGATVSIADRVARAAKAGCVGIFSMHINAGGGSGAVVLVPNASSYHHEFYTMGQKFARTLLPKINALGIGTWGDGAWERNYSPGETGGIASYYPNGGGYADYYGIVRYARLKGMFGVIIEHGFIDSGDASRLAQPAVRSALGKADAAAIKALYV